MKAFLTGSHVYGKPTEDSDIDLVILCDKETKGDLIDLSDDRALPIKFGKLNLIATVSEDEWLAWLMARNTVRERNPDKSIPKEEYLKIHQEVLVRQGFPYEGASKQ